MQDCFLQGFGLPQSSPVSATAVRKLTQHLGIMLSSTGMLPVRLPAFFARQIGQGSVHQTFMLAVHEALFES